MTSSWTSEEDYVKTYLKGTDHYRAKEWRLMTEAMEQALEEYLLAEESCRINCDKPFDMGWYPDFKSSVANHFTFCLKCKMNCAQSLNNFRGEFIENLVPTFYHYLQFGYFNVGNLTEAARCAWTHSYMVPGDKEMVTNVEYYKSRGLEDKWFTPRQEAVDYVLRDNDEEALLTFIEDQFVFDKVPRTDQDHSSEKEKLAEDEFIAKWSGDQGEYILEEKHDDSEHVNLQPPPVVKFSW